MDLLAAAMAIAPGFETGDAGAGQFTRSELHPRRVGDEEAAGELPVLVPVRDDHVRLAVRAVVTHAPQESASDAVCRNDGQAFPCRLARWGRRLLVTAGVSEQRVDETAAAGDPYASPWALTAQADGTYQMVPVSGGAR